LGLRLYVDECVDARITAGLRRRGIDVVTAAEVQLLGAVDAEHLSRATSLGRVLVSADTDFLQLCASDTSSPGLIFIVPESPVGPVVRAIDLIATALEPEEMTNRIEWVP
jgi:predicted nuclease of predicted toxin-antitoxin system